MSAPFAEMVDEELRDGNFVLGRFGQRDADRVADAVREQRADSDGALDASLQSVARLGDAQMDRVGHPLAIHRVGQQPVGGYHHARVARLHRDDDLIEPFAAADVQKLHRRGHHPLGRVAPLVEDALRERAVVDADAQRDASLAAAGDERFQIAAVEAVVARIDAHLVDVLRRHGRRFGQEMDVGHDSRRVTVGAQLRYDVAQVFGFADSLRREAHDGCAGAGDALDLGDARRGVARVGVGHRLHGHRLRAADGAGADADFMGRPAPVLRKIDHLFRFCSTKLGNYS